MPNTTLLDGQYSRGVYVGRARRRRPFQVNADRAATIVDRDWRIREKDYIPGAVGIEADPTEPRAYLMAESDPAPTGIADLLATTRTFATVPADQITYGSRVITKPNPSTIGTAQGTYRDYTASDTAYVSLGAATQYLSRMWANNQMFSSIAGGSGVITPATGGTFTVTYETSTTAALAYNAADATIAAAINALADVVSDGLVVSCSNALTSSLGLVQINITTGSTASRFTFNAASLTPTESSVGFNYYNASTSQFLRIGGRFTATAHGLTPATNLAVAVTGTTSYLLLLPAIHWSVVSADVLAINPAYLLGGSFSAVGQYLRAYTPGTDRIGIRQTQKFYLPGITSGITSPTSIPLPTVLLNDAEFLAAVIAYSSGYQTYDATELVRWNEWPIYTQTLIEINMADV